MSPQTPVVSKNRSWVWIGLFVWSLTAVIAVAAFRGQDTPPKPLGLKARPTPTPAPVPAQIHWETDFEKGLALAKRQDRPIMVDFYTDWCGACKILDKQIYPDYAVRAAATEFVTIKVDAEKRLDLAQTYGVTSYPTLVFARPDGQPLRIEGEGISSDPAVLVSWFKAARDRFYGVS